MRRLCKMEPFEISTRKRPPVHIDVTNMIDLVLILLIFFV